MNKILAGIALVASISCSVKAQVDPVILSIDGKDITKSEFENVYRKNNNKDAVSDKKSLQEYMDLFINFKLKVKEAEALGLDTVSSFKNELAGYRKQLAAPYLTDKNVNESLITEAYERMKTEVRATHILVKCAEDALPKDTLIAYNKILEYRKRALKGEDFSKLAVESAKDGDPSAAENKGDLGWFSAFQMVYPFEILVYNTKVGEISQITRTRFGYHIAKVVDKRPNQGEVLVSHIMLRFKKEMNAQDSANVKKKINELYTKLKAGEKFEDLAKQFSEDKQSSEKGGEVSWFAAGKMPLLEFEQQSFLLKNKGDYSEPFTTRMGWHIVKLNDKRPLASFESLKAEIKQKVNRDSRSQAGRSALIARVKKESNFTENKTMVKKKMAFPALDEITAVVDSTYFLGKWKAEKAAALKKNLFTLGGKNYTQKDFADFLESRQTRRVATDKAFAVEQQYKAFVEESVVAFEETQLEKKYPEFKALMQEYRDGILLFELTDRKVWSKAVKDTVGLKEYYEKNKNSYLWDERADVTTYKAANEDVAKQVRKMLGKKKTEKEILDEVNKKTQLNLSAETVTYIKGENKMVDANWKTGISDDIKQDGKVYILVVNKIMDKSPKQLNEAKGMVTADYQNYLEKDWLSNIRNNHKIVVKEEVLGTIK
ncbi:MAG: PpiC-type peptidyl-prolyl cis-trans isomerase [Bacteroidetes bacterium]|jgi:peptidyl-prolyl cis-trans isomerase SurA|nr:PpiC-type peptidyl-prolyl cis-trans isomerase [Bacteroidota bacterium]